MLLIAGIVAALVLLPTSGAAEHGHDVCASCHGADALGEGQSRPDSRICLECHSMTSLAGPKAPRDDPWPGHMWPDASRVDLGEGASSPREADCLTCHDPHARDGRGSVRVVESPEPVDAVSRLCLGCHRNGAYSTAGGGGYSRHPIGVEIPGGPPEISEILPVPVYDIHGTESREDDVVSCATCHTAHARRGEHLFRWESGDEATAACASCHGMHGESSGEAWLNALRRRR